MSGQKHKYNEAGVCPLCGKASLEYGNSGIQDENYFYSWSCANCGASGKEWYNLVFSEHIEMWAEARRSGTRGVPSIKELVKDAEDIDAMLKKLAEALSAAELEEGA